MQYVLFLVLDTTTGRTALHYIRTHCTQGFEPKTEGRVFRFCFLFLADPTPTFFFWVYFRKQRPTDNFCFLGLLFIL